MAAPSTAMLMFGAVVGGAAGGAGALLVDEERPNHAPGRHDLTEASLAAAKRAAIEEKIKDGDTRKKDSPEEEQKWRGERGTLSTRAGELVEVEADAQQRAKRDMEEYPAPEWLYPGDVTVGFCGASGVGKSSLINTVLQEDRAPVGVTEKTDKPTEYVVPRGRPLAGLRLWDLPGAGTPTVPRGEEYIKMMGIRYFDVLLIIGASRFTDTELDLYRAARKHNVPCFLLRNQVDKDISNELKDGGDDDAMAAGTVKTIRDDMLKNMQKEDADRVFVLTAKRWSMREKWLQDIVEKALQPDLDKFFIKFVEDVAAARAKK